MASVTQSIPNFLGGVSNQPDDKKLPGQVKKALNAYPDPTFGLTKRPGFKFITELADSSTAFDNNDLDTGKWFYYNRDSDERYIGCIIGASSSPYGQIYIWNTIDGTQCTVTYASNSRNYLSAVTAADYDLLTVRDATILTNKQKVVAAASTPSFTANKVATIRIFLVEYSAKYRVTIKKGTDTYTIDLDTKSGDTAANDAATTNFLKADDILQSLESGTVASTCGAYTATKVDGSSNSTSHSGGIESITGITSYVIGNTIEIEGDAAFTVEVSGGVAGNALEVYQNEVENIAKLSSQTIHNRVVKIINTNSSADTYYTKFTAVNAASGPGSWNETVAPNVSTGLDVSSMPHQLYNTAKNQFSFSQIDGSAAANNQLYAARAVGDDETNEHPSFVGKTIQQAFYYNNRLGFLTDDNVSMSQAGDFYNFYMTTAQTTTDADPIDISCSSVRPAVLHGIIPIASGLLLFSQNQQFLMFSADGNLSPKTALIRGLSNYKTEADIDPVDNGSTINFVSKTHATAGFTRVYGFQPQGLSQPPKVIDVARAVSEYIPATITNLTASPQNSFIAMYGNTEDKIYFYRTYNDGESDVVQAWFNWQCPGNVHYVTVDSDTMYSIIKTGTGGAARYNLVSATMTQTPEETIIVTADGQQVNPHMDFYKVTQAVSQYPLESITITNEGSSYSGTPTVTIAAPNTGTQATATAVVSGNKVTGITITNPGKGYDPVNPPAVTFSGGGGSNAAATAAIYDGSYCELPFSNLTSLVPVIIIAGNATSNFSGTTQSGFTITPGRATVNSVNYFTVPRKDLSAQAANVYVGYKYSYDVELPKLYFQAVPDGSKSDYTAALTISRIKFSIARSSVVGFKLKRKGVQAATQSFTGDGSNKIFSPDFDVKDKADVIVKKNGAKQILDTDYTIADHVNQPDNVTVTFTNAPAASSTSGNVTTAADTVEIYVDNWYVLQPTQDANYYLGDDVPLDTQSLFTVPIHQRTDNYTLRVYSDSPFPVALTSAMWEGIYSPRYYRRT